MASATNDLKVVVLGVLITPAQQAALERCWYAATGVDPGHPEAEQTTTDLVEWLVNRSIGHATDVPRLEEAATGLEVRSLGDALEAVAITAALQAEEEPVAERCQRGSCGHPSDDHRGDGVCMAPVPTGTVSMLADHLSEADAEPCGCPGFLYAPAPATTDEEPF